MLRRSAGHRTSPLIPVLRSLARFLPLVAALGLLASLLEGAGIGLFIPLIALLLSNSGGATVPPLLTNVAALFEGYEPQTRAAILAGAILALILLKGAVQAANDYLAAYAEGRISSQIRRAVASKLLELDYAFFLEVDNARLSHIVATDCWFVQSLTRAALVLAPAAAGLLMFAVLLGWLNLKLFLIVLVGGIIVQAALRLFERRQKQLSYETTAHDQRLWDRMLTLVHAPRVIRAFDQQSREEARTASAIEQLSRNIVASQTIRALIQPTMEALLAFLFLVVLVAGFWSGMSVATITVFLLILSRAQPHARTIATAYFSMISLRGSVSEIEWLLSQPSRQRHAATVNVRIDRDIILENLSYVYPDGSRVLDSLTATMPVGKATALMGESGSGKSTMVNLLVRLLEPQSGKICLGDRGIGQFDLGAWRRRVAIAGQDSELVTGTVYENIAYARPDASMSEVLDAVRAAGAESFIAELPRGFDTRLGPNGFSLSGGQRQRIGLARALLTRPDLLILDEATNAVDAATEAEIMSLIAEGGFYRTLIVISHRKLTLGRCDNGIVLCKGRVNEAGPLGDLAYYRNMAGETSEK